MQKFPAHQLRDWFVSERRDLPWRRQPTPYQVWISEVMLQQTQVAVVIPFYERWMRLFSTIEALAHAPLEQVLKCWEGLGYYSRARNLHRGAQYILEKFGGEIPRDSKEIHLIPGIGPYTSGAILSFAFHQKAAAVDGNVLRVLSRFTACEEEIDRPAVRKKLHAYAEAILPDEEPWLIAEGLIELGALVCTKKPNCSDCPLKQECLAYRHQLQDILPKKRAAQKTIHLIRQVAVIHHQGHFAVEKREKGKVMQDLYEFPYLETVAEELSRQFEQAFGLKLHYQKPLSPQVHSFTRYRAQLFPHLLEAIHRDEKILWKTKEELTTLPFSSGHKRILKELVAE